MNETIPAVVLGASGYVGGELLRLLHRHPYFELLAASSRGNAGTSLGRAFPHLASSFAEQAFVTPDEALQHAAGVSKLALFSAAPHGASAPMIERFLVPALATGTEIHVVDASADFRFSSRERFESVYRTEHGAAHRIPEFAAAVPEHLARCPAQHVGNPGCFASALLLAAVPLLKAGLVEPNLFAVGITGSTGSGKTPSGTTHHPVRHSNLYAYKALEHRHSPEVAELAERASGVAAKFHFVPHSGPFARGIHVTVQAVKRKRAAPGEFADEFRAFYADAPFVRIVDEPPRLKDVVGSNFAHIALGADADTLAVFCVIDNLVKGAAGSAMQWMNRLFELPESAGLDTPAPGWI